MTDRAPGRMESARIAALIDHTLLRPDAVASQIHTLCEEALQYGFCTVCINPVQVPLAARLLMGSPVKVCTVAGFPLGAVPSEVKLFETRQALEAGAREVDMVLNIGALKEGRMDFVAEEVRAVAAACREVGALSKVILETGLLTDTEKIAACRTCREAGSDFVKTSTGFGGSGATAADVALMRETVGPAMGVKAAGGIRSLTLLREMIAAGADRIGTSAGVQIMQSLTAESRPPR